MWRTCCALRPVSVASRRALVATAALPEGAACARGLQLRDTQLVASLDYDFDASAFSRAAQSVALYDFRAVPSRGRALPPQWEWHVEGGVSCLQRRAGRLLVGTCSGSILVWSAGQQDAAAAAQQLERRMKQRKEKVRHNPKIRGRFPKSPGFSNSKGFSR